jgi:hypothetical protein
MNANANDLTKTESAHTTALSADPPTTDQLLCELVSGVAPATIADVIARMQQIDALLPAADGLKWFNRLYLMVTQQVDLHPPGGAWQSPVWLTRLDVDFAGFYFRALCEFLCGRAVPCAWSTLLKSRHRTGIDRIQFALAGMNAHINHDLALALVQTDSELGVTPALDSPEHIDFQSVNGLLTGLMPATLTMLAVDTLGVLAEDTGKIGRLLASLDIAAARDLAWDFAGRLRELDGLAREAALAAQDAITGAAGLALLAAV